MKKSSDSTQDGNKQQDKAVPRGFASMDGAKQREIAKKGGEAVSGDRKHMAEIGKKGGETKRRRKVRVID